MQSKKAFFCLALLRCSLTCDRKLVQTECNAKQKSNFLPCMAEVQPNLRKVYCIFYKDLMLYFQNDNDTFAPQHQPTYIYIICQHELNEKSEPLHRWLKSTAMASITASSFVQNAKSCSTMPNLDSSAANLATRSILAKSAPFIATSLVCDKRCRASCVMRALACYGTTPLPPYGTC